MNVFCPNCGKRYLNFPDDFLGGEPGCGDCAQAGVRPRELFKLLPFTPWSEDTVYAPAEDALRRMSEQAEELGLYED